jgi:hypothetical protein
MAPVRKTVDVKAGLERAFRHFTSDIGSWWPLESHSLSQDKAATCVLEGRVGGRFLELGQEGEETLWGTLTQ